MRFTSRFLALECICNKDNNALLILGVSTFSSAKIQELRVQGLTFKDKKMQGTSFQLKENTRIDTLLGSFGKKYPAGTESLLLPS